MFRDKEKRRKLGALRSLYPCGSRGLWEDKGEGIGEVRSAEGGECGETRKRDGSLAPCRACFGAEVRGIVGDKEEGMGEEVKSRGVRECGETRRRDT